MPQQFGDVERIAVGLADDRLREPASRPGQLVPGGGLHERHHVVFLEAGERDATHTLLTMEVRQEDREGVIVSQLGVAVGAEHEQSKRGVVGGHVPQQ